MNNEAACTSWTVQLTASGQSEARMQHIQNASMMIETGTGICTCILP